MADTINTYKISDPDILVPMDRKEFYDEQIKAFEENGEPTRVCEVVDVFVFNTKGELLIQKRSPEKKHNSGLLDKSLGGHIDYGNPVDYTVMVETVQELQIPSIVLKNKTDFKKTYDLLDNYLNTIAVMRHIDGGIYTIPKKIGDKMVKISNKVHIYFGIYDGRIRPADGEAQGVLWYTLGDLEKEMKQFPDIFTQDLHIFMEEYKDELEGFVKSIKKEA